ncbi:MAG: M60 family metallopeptidase [Planctomycetota bacterium]
MAALTKHIRGDTRLSAELIDTHKQAIDAHAEAIGAAPATIRAAFDLVGSYDEILGPLWVARDGFNRRGGAPANDIHWTVYCVMQHIMDKVFTPENLARHPEMLGAFEFGSAAHFPGAVDPPVNPHEEHVLKINGSYPRTFGHLVMHAERPARKPTGTYLAPGTIATVTVPASLVGKGYEVRVGAHSWDLSRKPRVLRLDRCSLAYPIDSTEVAVASPLGGGIYIEVPYLADAGVVDVSVRNAVRAPYFSAKSFHQTSLAEWTDVERHHSAPWADFQSDKFMMQVPTSWIYNLDDPVTLMKEWDDAMDAMNDLMGRPRIGGKETMYPQVDVQLRARVFAPGYPSVNQRYDPTKDYGGDHASHLVRGPRSAPDYEFHEKGHGYLFAKYPGERESAVNLLHVAVWNQKFGYSLDEAFRGSRNFNQNTHRTLDNTAVTWMTSFNFVLERPMQAGEKAYQLKGHAKFVDIARLFGWTALNEFWRSINVDFERGEPWPRNVGDIDRYSLRLCDTAGADLRPLLHFWGTPPNDAAAFEAAIRERRLPRSSRIYDALLHYRALVPDDNAEFRTFARKWWGKQPASKGYWTEREHARRWDEYTGESAAQIRTTVQEIVERYFPDGRPKDGESTR